MHFMNVEVQGQLVGIGSLFPSFKPMVRIELRSSSVMTH